MWFDLIKKYYLMGLYTDSDLDLFQSVAYITADQEAEIKAAKTSTSSAD